VLSSLLVAFVLLHLGARALVAASVLAVSTPVLAAVAARHPEPAPPAFGTVLVLAFAIGFALG
jgi:hypothetical protein